MRSKPHGIAGWLKGHLDFGDATGYERNKKDHGDRPEQLPIPHADLEHLGTRKQFLESFKKKYADLVKGREIVLLDCLKFTNPGHNADLCAHVGCEVS